MGTQVLAAGYGAPGGAAIRREEGWLRDDGVPAAFLLIACAAVATCMPPQNDTFWLLRSGQEMWTSGSILLTERFSHTAFGGALYNHEWITELLFFGLFRIGGPLLLTVACAGFAVASVFGSWRLTRGSAELRVSALAVLVMTVAPVWAVRPQVISTTFFVVALSLATARKIQWLPVICLLWSNVHGMVLLGVVIAGCEFLESSLWSRRRMPGDGVVALACVIVPMATPLGWHYWPRVWDTVTSSRALGIQEYRTAFEILQLPFWMTALALVIVAIACSSRWLQADERETRVLLFVSIVLAIAGGMSVRNIPFFMLVAVPALSRLIAPTRVARSNPAGTWAMPLLGAALVVALAITAYRWRDGGKMLGWLPMSPAAANATARCDGPLFNGFEDGGPIMWFVPGRQVFVDSRVEAYPFPLLARSRRADVGGMYKSLFADYAISCATVPTGSVMAFRLAKDVDAVRTYSDDQWSVFAMTSASMNARADDRRPAATRP